MSYESFKTLSEEKDRIEISVSSFTKELRIDDRKLELKLSLKTCQIGEYFSLDNLRCMPCEANFFSLTSDFIEPSACKSCAQEHFYCYGGFQLTPKPGYWRKHSDTVNFIKCPNEKGILRNNR